MSVAYAPAPFAPQHLRGKTYHGRKGPITNAFTYGVDYVLIDPAALTDRTAFEAEAQSFIGWAKASPPREGFPPVMTAGEPERASRAKRSAEGVPVDATTWSEILDAARKLGVDPAAVQREAGLG